MTADNDQGYAGQEGLTSSNNPFNATSFLILQLISKINTMKVVQVKKVTNAGELAAVGFVDVHPLVNQIDGLGKATPHGTIFNVPYFRLQGGKNAVIIDPQVDDIGIMVVSDRDISAVKNTKKEANPGSKRKYNSADGVYIGGILNGVPDQYITFTATGIKIVDKNGHVIEMKSDGTHITGDLFVTGDVQSGDGAQRVTLRAHQHIGNNLPPTPGH